MNYVICFIVGALFVLADVHSQIFFNFALFEAEGFWNVVALSFVGCGIALVASIFHNKSFGIFDFVDMLFIMAIIALFDNSVGRVIESAFEIFSSMFGQLIWIIVFVSGFVILIKPVLESWKRVLSLCAALSLLFSALVIISRHSDISHDVYLYTAAFMMAAVKADINAKRRKRHV